MSTFTEDRFLGGRVVVRQPERGFRSGTDAVLVAAAVPVLSGERVLELGSGAGVASLCLAARSTASSIMGVEILPALVEIANGNARANNMAPRVQFVVADSLNPATVEIRDTFDHVFVNPPFHGDVGESSPTRERALALQDEGRLGDWLTAAFRRVRSRGTFTAIIRADRFAEALRHLPSRGLTVLPLWPHKEEPAKRLIIQTRKDSRVPFVLLPGLVLHDRNGTYTSAADAVLRGAALLALATPHL